ncbi:MAG: ABC transporter substrate-binding protein [Rikenellaceae bacterium]
MRLIHNIIALTLLSLMSSCIFTSKKGVEQSGNIGEVDTIEVRHAEGFTVVKRGDCHFVEVNDMSENRDKVYRYALIPHSEPIDSIPADYQIIRTPVTRIICMTTLQLSPLLKLDAADRVVGLTSTRYLHNKQIKERLSQGEIKRIGIEGEFDNEVVMASRPEVIFTSPFKRGGYDGIADLGFTTFNYLGYKESSPLGQAEWIKLVGIMLGEGERAEQIFNKIESEYLSLKQICQEVASRPKVMSGELHSGSWYVVGGESYLANLFRDAGAEYFMDNDSESGGFYVDYETVYSQGHDADFWRIVNSYNGEYSYDVLLSSDGRYADFKPLKNRGVIYCNLRQSPFYESTPIEPEVVLSDLIKIFHPELLPTHEPVYYKLLK